MCISDSSESKALYSIAGVTFGKAKFSTKGDRERWRVSRRGWSELNNSRYGRTYFCNNIPLCMEASQCFFRCGNRPGYGCDRLDVIGSIVKPVDVEHYCAQLVKGFVAWGLSYMVEDELVGVRS